MPRRIGALALLLGLLGLVLGCDRLRGGPDRIVLVTIDTLRADRVGAYGDFSARTPNLDEIAARGVRFEHAIAPAPLTLPSHTSLMTGLQPPAHGVRHNSVFEVDEELPLLAERMGAAGYATGAFVGAFVLNARFGLDRGFDVYDDRLGQRSAAKTPFAFAERRADAVVDAAIQWVDEAPERFFLWVHMFDPHADYDPPPRYARDAVDPYAGEISFADAEVGRLLQHVIRRHGREGLLVAITSDHGESLGEHSEATHSYTVYDATQRVPLLLMGKGVPSGRVVDAQVRLVDVAPTLLAMAGADPLGEPGEIHGRDLRPVALGAEEERVAYVETLATQLDMGWSPLLGVRTSAFKYIRAPQPELYDLREDPEETRNLALTRPEEVRELDRALEAQLENARPVRGSFQIDEGDRERLESLGYVVPREEDFGRELGVVGGPNPRDHMLDAARAAEARHALADGDPERSLSLLESLGESFHVAKIRARAALAADRPELAVETLEALRARGDFTLSELTELGMAYMAAGRIADARAAFEAVRAADPELPAPLAGLGYLALHEGDLASAEAWFVRSEEHMAQPEAGRVHRAIVRLAQGRPDEADALLEGIRPEFLTEPSRALQLARAELRAGRGERAASLLRRAIREYPKHRHLLATQASVLESLGRFDDAVRLWTRVHELAPDDPGGRNDLAWGLAMAGRDLDRALELAQGAAQALEDDAAVLDTLAAVHLARGESAEALEVAERALAGGAADALRLHLLYVRAVALDGLGRQDEAREVLRSLVADLGEMRDPWKSRVRDLAQRLGLDDDEIAHDGAQVRKQDPSGDAGTATPLPQADEAEADAP